MNNEMVKLYSIASPAFAAGEVGGKLYRQGDYHLESGILTMKVGDCLDLGTYFNAFSVKKWIKYTHLKGLKISVRLKGNFDVSFYGMSQHGAGDGKSENYGEEIFATETSGNFVHEFDFDELKNFAERFDLIGVKFVSKTDGAEFYGGEYSGEFESVRDVKIGITICTFKREKYLLPNLKKMKKLTEENPDFSVMVIDNGQTLEEKKSDALQIFHNRNYGGAGGFARGLLEQVSLHKNTHVLLMDDDIVVEISSFERLYSFLKGLKPEYNENFFAGAMINLDKPHTQIENTANWHCTRLYSFGSEFDLTDKRVLCINENPPTRENVYAAWFFCCMPLAEVEKNGYPLPIFFKGDDMEYGLRHGGDLLSLNGIGVWHEHFSKKYNMVTEYFTSRNIMLIQHLANKNFFARFIFLYWVMRRTARNIRHMDGDNMRVFFHALKDLDGDLEGITSIPSDEKFMQIKNFELSENAYTLVFETMILGLKHFLTYGSHTRRIKNFISEKLSDQKFWREFLKIE